MLGTHSDFNKFNFVNTMLLIFRSTFSLRWKPKYIKVHEEVETNKGNSHLKQNTIIDVCHKTFIQLSVSRKEYKRRTEKKKLREAKSKTKTQIFEYLIKK